jgi:uncharacterized protein YcbK (DUF882 family)
MIIPALNITQSFTYKEAACHDGTQLPPGLLPHAQALALMLERIRARMGVPLIPVSWYRTPVYNARIGGARASQHMTGGAADIRPANMADMPGLLSCIDLMLRGGELPELGGWGIYPAWVHVDVRRKPPSGHVAHWRGVGVGSEAA